MANFFSADYWKALYFKAMGGQETAVDPNAMSGTFAGIAAFTGTLDQPEGALSGTFAGTADFGGALVNGAVAGIDQRDGKRREPPIVVDMADLRRQWEQEDKLRETRARLAAEQVAARRATLRQALGLEDEVAPTAAPSRDELRARAKSLADLLAKPAAKFVPDAKVRTTPLIDFKARAQRKAFIAAEKAARAEAAALKAEIERNIRNYDDALILLLLAA